MTAQTATRQKRKDDAVAEPAYGPPLPLVGELLNFSSDPRSDRHGPRNGDVSGAHLCKQAAILWLIHSRADAAGWVRRKDIETRLATWFEMSNSNVSKLLRELSKPPLSRFANRESYRGVRKSSDDKGRREVRRRNGQGVGRLSGGPVIEFNHG